MRFALSLLASTGLVFAQPAFEVASVKPNHLDTRGFIGFIPAGKGYRGFQGTDVRLKILVMLAYGVADRRISGGPGWVESDGFDIDARAEKATSQEEIRLMLQTLLADRFQLKVRRETREEPVYALLVEKDPPNLVPHDDDGSLPMLKMGSKPGERVFSNLPISRLVLLLEGETGRTVLDKSSLEGSYDFKLEYTSNLTKGSREDPEVSGPSIFKAVREKLGLKLEPQRGPSEYLTIERAKKPSAN
jgi:uncharacterized protein (TIGR03435 family)